jgi:peptide/nickel transport system ATP-binding protein
MIAPLRPQIASHYLEVRDLSVSFEGFDGTSRVIDHAALQVRDGELISIVGETGCGKSVLMKTVLDLIPSPPAIVSGRIEFDGENLLDLPPKRRRALTLAHFGIVFQDPVGSLNPFFKIGAQLTDVLHHAARRRGRRLSGAQARRRAAELLRQVQLHDPERVLGAYPFQLSGGMNQRVSIAMALGTDPWLIVADEPTTALDVTVQAEILELFKGLVRAGNRSVLFITHSMGVVREIADRIYVMYAGAVVEAAPTTSLFAEPKHPYTSGLLACVPRLTGEEVAKGIPGALPDYTAPPSGCRFHPRCPHAMPVCESQRPAPFIIRPGHQAACWLYGDH